MGNKILTFKVFSFSFHFLLLHFFIFSFFHSLRISKGNHSLRDTIEIAGPVIDTKSKRIGRTLSGLEPNYNFFRWQCFKHIFQKVTYRSFDLQRFEYCRKWSFRSFDSTFLFFYEIKHYKWHFSDGKLFWIQSFSLGSKAASTSDANWIDSVLNLSTM